MTELDESREAYHSRKSSAFASWDLWDPELRTEVLNLVKLGFCRNSYQTLLEDVQIMAAYSIGPGLCDFEEVP